MSFRVVGLTGFAGCGKDTAAQALIAQGYVRVSLADPVREALLALDPYVYKVAKSGIGHWQRLSTIVRNHSWADAKAIPEVRRLLQRMGTEAGRGIHGQECWTDIADRKLAGTSRSGTPGAVITDIRFVDEARWMRTRFTWPLLLHIDRPGNGPANDHKSESLEQVFAMADAKIVNDGTVEELHRKVLAACGMEAVPA